MIPLILTVALCGSGVFSQQEEVDVTVIPGNDVLLHCMAPKNGTITTLEWSRLDLRDDNIVFFYRRQSLLESYQETSFRGRVQLADPKMKNGNLSVILKSTTQNDSGIYKCRVFMANTKRTKRAISDIKPYINLKVEPLGTATEQIEEKGKKDGGNEVRGRNHSALAVVVFLVAMVSSGMICLILFKRLKKSFTPPVPAESAKIQDTPFLEKQ